MFSGDRCCAGVDSHVAQDVLVLLLLPQWGGAEELRFSYGVESFLWEEFDDNGNLLLDETGFRHVFALRGENRFDSQWLGDFDAHVVFGTVAYDGQDQSGNPVSTNTEYSGYGLEVGFNYFPSEVPTGDAAGAGVRLALGMDVWDRNLLGAGGYNEHYMATYGRVAGVYVTPAVWQMEFGAKLPVAASESVDLSAYGFVDEINLNPKGQPSLYANFSYNINERFLVGLTYDGYAFAKSDEDIVYNLDGNYYAIHQPKSSMQTLTLSVSLSL
ncbi:MAG: hypothetical protein ABFS08_01520 [Pseudomonadota bacterium]